MKKLLLASPGPNAAVLAAAVSEVAAITDHEAVKLGPRILCCLRLAQDANGRKVTGLNLKGKCLKI